MRLLNKIAFVKIPFFAVIIILILQPRPVAQVIFSFPIDFELKKKFPPNEALQIIGVWEDNYRGVKILEFRKVDGDIVKNTLITEKLSIKDASGMVIAQRWQASLGPYNPGENVQIGVRIEKEPTLEQQSDFKEAVRKVQKSMVFYTDRIKDAAVSVDDIKNAIRLAFSVFDSVSFKGIKHVDQDEARETLGEYLLREAISHYGYFRNAMNNYNNARGMFTSIGLGKQEVAECIGLHETLMEALRTDLWDRNMTEASSGQVNDQFEGLQDALNAKRLDLKDYRARLNDGLKDEASFKAVFDSLVAIEEIHAVFAPDPYAITLEDIRDWLNVDVGFMAVPAFDEVMSTFNVRLFFTKRNRNYSYKISNFLDWKNRINLNIGTKLFNIDDENITGTPVYIGLGYQLNRFFSAEAGPFIIKSNKKLRVETQVGMTADVNIVRYLLSELSKAIKIFDQTENE